MEDLEMLQVLGKRQTRHHEINIISTMPLKNIMVVFNEYDMKFGYY